MSSSIVRRSAGLFAALMLAAACSSSAPAEKAALVSAMKEYDRFVVAMDARAIAGMYTADGIMRQGDTVVARGPEAIRAFLAPFNDNFRVLSNVTTIDSIEISGATARVLAHYDQSTLVIASKETVSSKGRLESEWVHQVDGRWRVMSMTAR